MKRNMHKCMIDYNNNSLLSLFIWELKGLYNNKLTYSTTSKLARHKYVRPCEALSSKWHVWAQRWQWLTSKASMARALLPKVQQSSKGPNLQCISMVMCLLKDNAYPRSCVTLRTPTPTYPLPQPKGPHVKCKPPCEKPINRMLSSTQ